MNLMYRLESEKGQTFLDPLLSNVSCLTEIIASNPSL